MYSSFLFDTRIMIGKIYKGEIHDVQEDNCVYINILFFTGGMR